MHNYIQPGRRTVSLLKRERHLFVFRRLLVPVPALCGAFHHSFGLAAAALFSAPSLADDLPPFENPKPLIV